jgi:hypothetical protein
VEELEVGEATMAVSAKGGAEQLRSAGLLVGIVWPLLAWIWASEVGDEDHGIFRGFHNWRNTGLEAMVSAHRWWSSRHDSPNFRPLTPAAASLIRSSNATAVPRRPKSSQRRNGRSFRCRR